MRRDGQVEDRRDDGCSTAVVVAERLYKCVCVFMRIILQVPRNIIYIQTRRGAKNQRPLTGYTKNELSKNAACFVPKKFRHK